MNRFKPKWQYTHRIVENLMRIHAAREIVMLLELRLDIEEKLKKESVIKTVHYSTKIEGNNLSLEEVYEAIENERHSDRKDVREVRNYYNALLFLDKKADKRTKITEDLIKELHSIIEVRHTGGRTKRTPYRDGQNAVRDSISGSIVYLPPEVKDVPVLMKALADWIEDKENYELPAPILSAIAAYQLVTIHPFWDGNGRTARALATYILKKYNYDLKGFYSMEEFYDKDIERYYDSLQMKLNHNYYFGRNDADLTPWITYFLDIMVEVFEKVSKRVSSLYKEGKPKESLMDILDKRQRVVANHIMKKGSIRANDIVNYFNVDKKTARLWLENWTNEGFVQRKDLSQQRNIEYILAEKYLRGI